MKRVGKEFYSTDRWVAAIKKVIIENPDRLQALRQGCVQISITDLVMHNDIGFNTADYDRHVVEAARLAAQQIAKEHACDRGDIIITMHKRSISELRALDVGRIVTVHGLVKIASYLAPHYEHAWFKCMRCGAAIVVEQKGLRELEFPLECYKERGGCGRAAASTKFIQLFDNEECKFLGENKLIEPDPPIDERWLEIQEPPGSVEAADRPQAKLVRAMGERMSEQKVLPGDLVNVTGLLLPDDEKHKKLAPPTYIEAHHIEVLSQIDWEITEEERALIEKVAHGPDPLAAIVASIAPHIVGHDEVKEGLACQQFGGVDRQIGTKKLRGTINVILPGDPAVAKTELQRTMVRISPRGVFASAKSASQVGLTAAAVQEREFGEGRWVLRAGAIVLADRGTLAIDEVGELEIDDFKAIEEAMESQTISVAKAGMVTTLNARTSILAAGNPRGGVKWNEELTLHDQIDIPPSTLSRFDLLYIMRDDIKKDDEIVSRIDQYHGVGDVPEQPPLSEKMLRSYIIHAKHINPKLTPEAATIFHAAYKKMRTEIENTPFTPRTYEGYLRIGASLARMQLSGIITAEDAERAVRIHHAGWAPIIDEHFKPQGTDGPDRAKGVAWNVIKRLQGGPISAKELAGFICDLGFQGTTPGRIDEILDAKNQKGEVAYEMKRGEKIWRFIE